MRDKVSNEFLLLKRLKSHSAMLIHKEA